MLQEFYFTIGIVVAILFFITTLMNLIFNFTNKILFTGLINIYDDIDKSAAIIISFFISLILIVAWVIFIPFLLLYIIIKLIRSINYKYLWKELGLLGHAARLARDNQYGR